MKMRLVVCATLMALVAAPVRAQDRALEAQAWQSLVATLQPGTLIEIRLTNGTRFKGTLMQREPDRLTVKPRTRVPVPARDVAIADVEAIELAKVGMSPAKKVLIGIGVSVGVLALVGAAIVASAY